RLTNGDKADFGQEKKNRRRTRKNGYDHEDVCKGARVSARADDDGIRVDPRRSRGRGVHRLRDHGHDHQERADQRGQPTLIEKGEIPGWRTNPSATPHQKISICSCRLPDRRQEPWSLSGAPRHAPPRETTPEKTTTLGGEVNEPAEESLPDNKQVRVVRL